RSHHPTSAMRPGKNSPKSAISPMRTVSPPGSASPTVDPQLVCVHVSFDARHRCARGVAVPAARVAPTITHPSESPQPMSTDGKAPPATYTRLVPLNCNPSRWLAPCDKSTMVRNPVPVSRLTRATMLTAPVPDTAPEEQVRNSLSPENPRTATVI